MYMALAHASVRDANETGLLQFFDRLSPAVAHAGTKPACKLINYFIYPAFICNAPLNAFWYVLFDVCFYILEITVTASVDHCSQGTHSAVFFKLSSFVYDCFSR